MSANIVHARIDYRLIHGQVITKWLKQCGANRIIIIDNDLSKDNFLGQVYKMAAPAGVKVDIVSISKASNLWAADKIVQGDIFVLFKSIEMAESAIDAGLQLNSLQVGGYEKKENRKNVHMGIYLNNKDLKKLENISNKGTEVYFQTIPGEEIENLNKISKKIS